MSQKPEAPELCGGVSLGQYTERCVRPKGHTGGCRGPNDPVPEAPASPTPELPEFYVEWLKSDPASVPPYTAIEAALYKNAELRRLVDQLTESMKIPRCVKCFALLECECAREEAGK